MYIVRQVFRNDFTMSYLEGEIVFVSHSKRLARLHRDSLVNSIHDPDTNIEYWLEKI